MKKYQIFKSPYILIEDIKGKCQPFYKEYTGVVAPVLNLSSPPMCCPFLENKKFKSSVKRKKAPKQGFCEICYTKYSDYELHVKEQEHRDFAVDDENYREIDELISQIDDGYLEFLDTENDNIPVSPLWRKTPGSSLDNFTASLSLLDTETEKENIDTLVFSKPSENEIYGENYLDRIVPDVDSFINEFLNK
ncbi:DBF zinc finger domain-containing protein [Hamiltosporidium tvaerminnensis]|uniref:DBF zinc finger domain-containing protein n=2 Tax=Hamiltosporidium TaxID=1176354 RepID=A0A4Q9KRZ6_9MICR|nr:Cdc7p-Dbf4p kinase complex regulatory subunit [Hamiltosporidium tvaerminnensis]TBT97522.1 DBF zinc finger domain-containing protein [Hamiltosporidium magnivora]TBT98425.1 DBF zinc finger domain-containing protein [Hamiltosporidium tvaerminnensis]TBU02464.1 DBF zinc finger domain-containing protein [Hamiltosporidium magnivora]